MDEDRLPEPKNLLSPKNDWLFKKLLTADGMEEGLIDLIASFIRQPVKSARIYKNELPADGISEKQIRLDINCVTDDGTRINVEMQTYRMEEPLPGEFENLKSRTSYYLAKLHSSQDLKGKQYYKAAKTYQILFCTYSVFENPNKFLNEFTMKNDEGDTFNNDLNVIYVELTKLKEILKKSAADMSPAERWSIFLEYADNPEHFEIVKSVAEVNGAIKMVLKNLIEASQDEAVRWKAMSREKFLLDAESDRLTAYENGIQTGVANERKEIVQKMRLKGFSEDIISDITGFSFEDINKI
jgi:predicted transposase/invertase (TIGR01784 family)